MRYGKKFSSTWITKLSGFAEVKMKGNQHDAIKRIALVGILTALATVLSFIKIPILGAASITLVLPVVVIGSALCGPLVGAWLTVIPNIMAFSEAGIFMVYSPVGCVVTLLLKGILAGFLSGLIYKLLSHKHPIGAVACSAVVAPTVNSAVFTLGCYLFIWEQLVSLAKDSGVGIGMLIFGLVIVNYIVELVLNVILCPAILRIIHIATKKKIV